MNKKFICLGHFAGVGCFGEEDWALGQVGDAVPTVLMNDISLGQVGDAVSTDLGITNLVFL